MHDKSAHEVTERVTVAASELLTFIKGMIAQGNARRLIVRTAAGSPLLDIPLTAGVVVSGALTLLLPLMTAVGAIAALVKQVQVEIIRHDDYDVQR